MTVSSFWAGFGHEVKIKTRLRGSTWSGRGGSGFGLVSGSAWWEQYISDSGVSPSLVLDYSGAVGGQFSDGSDINLSFDDLHTFARASLATQRDTDGLLKFVPHNSMKQGNDFSVSPWGRVEVNVVKQATGPDGIANSAWTLTSKDSGGQGANRCQQDIVVVKSSTYDVSVMAKASTLSWMNIRVENFTSPASGNNFFDLGNGVVGTAGTGYTLSMTDEGAGWYNCTVAFLTATDTTGRIKITLANADLNDAVARDGLKQILITNASFRQTPMAPVNDTISPTYIPTTGSAVFQHRLDHDSNGNRIGLLLEKVAGTNSMLDSENFGGVWVSSSATITDNDAVSPSGVTNADKIADLASGSVANVNQPVTCLDDSLNSCFSIFVLKDSVTNRFPELLLRFKDGTQLDYRLRFNTQTGALEATQGLTLTDFGIIDYTNYWRVWFSGINNTSGNVTCHVFISPARSATLTGSVDNSVQGDITCWGAMLELGKSVPSSYIPTTAVAVTRAAETAPILVSDYAYSATAGSVAANVTPIHTPTTELILVSFNDTTANEVIQVVADSSANVDFDIVDGGVGQASIDSLINAVANTELKVAASWAANDFAISVNGATIKVDTGGTLPTLTTISPCDNGHTTSIRAWTVALSDADLIAEGT